VSNSSRRLTLHDSTTDLLERGANAWDSFVKRAPAQFFENQSGGEDAKRFITAEEAAAYLGGRYTEGAIRMKTHRQEIPHFKVGSDVYYTRESLDLWRTMHFIAPKLGS